MLPEVEHFITVQVKAVQNFNDAYTEIRATLFHDDRAAYRAKEAELTEARDTAIKNAWDAMKTSSDKMVVFIAENCWEYREAEAQDALMLLPCAPETLRFYADKSDWCSTFKDFEDMARMQGIFGGEALSSEMIELFSYLRKELHLSTRIAKKALDKMQRIVATEAARATANSTATSNDQE